MVEFISVTVKACIEAESTIKDNLIELLKRRREVTHKTEDIPYPYLAVIETLSRMFNLQQEEDEDLFT